MISKVKSKILAQEYIKNNFNATATIEKLEPYKTKDVAKVKGSRMLSSVYFKESLDEIMAKKGLNDELITNIHERNLKQNKSIPASNEAINIYHKLKGNYAPEKKAVLNINISDPQSVQKRISDLQTELKQLDGQRDKTA